VYAGDVRYPLGKHVEAIGLQEMVKEIESIQLQQNAE
jgi:hypothetical protein